MIVRLLLVEGVVLDTVVFLSFVITCGCLMRLIVAVVCIGMIFVCVAYFI